MSKIATPYDVATAGLEDDERFTLFQRTVLRIIYQELQKSYRTGYKAGDAAHNCQDTGCPCYEAGKEAEAEEPSLSGRQT